MQNKARVNDLHPSSIRHPAMQPMASHPWHALDAVRLQRPAFSPTLLTRHSQKPPFGTCPTTVLLVHTQPRLLYTIVDDSLQRCWSFPHDIVSFCWSDGPDNHIPPDTDQPAALVATEDGHVWNIPLFHPGPAPVASTTDDATHRTPPAKVTIKIEDSDDEEEVELWNDEDGLLEDAEMFESLSPISKRQRTSSPPPSGSSSSSVIQDTMRRCVKVDPLKHSVGSEDSVIKTVFALGGLLIFRRDKEPILWTSQHGFSPRKGIEKRLVEAPGVHFNNLSQVHAGQLPDTVFIGTTSGAIYGLEKSPEALVARKLYSLQEPISSLILVPCQNTADTSTLIAMGTIGSVAMIDLHSRDSSTTASGNKSIDTNIHGAFAIDTHVYVHTADGRVLLIPLSSLSPGSTFNMEHLELPFLRAFVPIVSNTGLHGFYGLNGDGQILRFSADLTRLRQSQIVSGARDDVAKALSELERISEQARLLEAECQLENQRIGNYNRLVHELQRCILSQSDQDAPQDPQSIALPVQMELTVSVQAVAVVCGGSSSRCRIQLDIRSALNIDWSTGWSAVINVHSDTKSCPHGWSPKIGQHCDIMLSLAGLSPSAAWIHNIDIDVHRFRLPLAVTVGLRFDERDKQSNNSQFGSYFVVESAELDVIHFSEPVRDRSKQQYCSIYHAIPTMSRFGDLQNVNSKDDAGDSKSRIYRQPLGNDDTCSECAEASGKPSTSTALRPLVFEIDTKEIQVAQCLPALLGGGIPHDQVMALVHSVFQASLYVLEEFLPHSRRPLSGKPVTLVQDDSGIVWLTMDVKEGASGSNTQVSIEVMGADPRRILAVHQALEKRVEDLFG